MFLGVVIGLEGIKIEEEKVKDVLDWLKPKCVKNVQKFFGIGKPLQTVCQGFCKGSKTPT